MSPILLLLFLYTATMACGGSILSSGNGASAEGDAAPENAAETAPDDTGEDIFVAIEDTHLDNELPDEDAGMDESEPETVVTQCSDGLDNDGDTLIDLEDFDCPTTEDDVEGSEIGQCTNDGHCNAGWNECNLVTNTCYDPSQGNICDPCWNSTNCGDGVTGNNPDRDYCVYLTYRGYCSKDCAGDFDCPRGFRCDYGEDTVSPGSCLPYVGSCESREFFGTTCSSENECNGLQCHSGICTSDCRIEHDCPQEMSCTGGWCFPD